MNLLQLNDGKEQTQNNDIGELGWMKSSYRLGRGSNWWVWTFISNLDCMEQFFITNDIPQENQKVNAE